ncbi:hexamerin 70c [Xylocopa sonorina]|uniref:hexamerin 70c n=1 Tax=Xylocopa sonorina TaxID=1818115 RepID=UPI00403AD8A3
MLKVVALLLALGAFCAADTRRYSGTRTADMDFLHKQKKIFDLMLYVRQADLIDAEWYDIGRNYNMESNMDMYRDKNVVQKFLWWYKQGMFLSRSAIFTPSNSEQLYEMKMLFDLFYNAKDFQTFYKTACWARLHMNSGIFTSAFTVAVFYRNDCKYMRLPAIYEIYPQYFFDSSVIQEAQYLKMSRGNRGATGMDNIETYMVTANYSSKYMMPYNDDEYKLDYFMEDPNMNAYYYYMRQMFPFWLSSKYGMPKEIRGQFYYFFHQQLMAKYFLERMSNGLGKIAEFDWHKPIYPGYYSTMMFPNGISLPQRDRYSKVPYYKYKYLREINALEMRIMDAIDSGYLMDERGKKVDIYTPEGLNMLGNVIEGNVDSCNRKFYGKYDALARDILGFNYDYENKNNVIPSALQCYCTNMRDPAFYMLYKRIMTYFFRFKKYQPQYTDSDLQLPGVKFESVNMDKLYTYFDTCHTLINNAVSVENFKSGMSLRLKARRACLNYQPFTYKININSDKEMKGMLRIFLGPAFHDVKNDMVYLQKYYSYFMEMDQFVVNLRPGNNNIERRSSESMFTSPDMMSSDMYYDKLNKAISGSEPFMYSERMFGLTERFTLPRGKPEGMKFKMFFFLSSMEDGNTNTYELPMYGKVISDGKPFGFPLDRPMYAWNFTIPNMYFKDVYIYNRQSDKERMNY